jgi:hypothetical protein
MTLPTLDMIIDGVVATVPDESPEFQGDLIAAIIRQWDADLAANTKADKVAAKAAKVARYEAKGSSIGRGPRAASTPAKAPAAYNSADPLVVKRDTARLEELRSLAMKTSAAACHTPRGHSSLKSGAARFGSIHAGDDSHRAVRLQLGTVRLGGPKPKKFKPKVMRPPVKRTGSPLQCQDCGKTFGSKGAKRQHCEAKHGAKPRVICTCPNFRDRGRCCHI